MKKNEEHHQQLETERFSDVSKDRLMEEMLSTDVIQDALIQVKAELILSMAYLDDDNSLEVKRKVRAIDEVFSRLKDFYK